MSHATKRSVIDVLRELLARSQVGVASANATDLARTIAGRARTAEGCKAVTVLIDDAGSVYAPKSTAASAILAAHIVPAWVVGTYSVAATPEQIAEELWPALGNWPGIVAARRERNARAVTPGWGFA